MVVEAASLARQEACQDIRAGEPHTEAAAGIPWESEVPLGGRQGLEEGPALVERAQVCWVARPCSSCSPRPRHRHRLGQFRMLGGVSFRDGLSGK